MPKAETAPAKKAASPNVTGATHNRVEFSDDDWFTPLDETEDFINVLYYGREGSTKTTNAAAAANISGDGKVLVVNAEGGLKVDALRRRGINTKNVVRFPKDPNERITRAQLDGIYRKVRADLDRDPNSWYAVVWDSVTELVQTLVDEAQQKRINDMKRKGLTPNEDFIDRDDYGVMTKVARDQLRKFRDLECHFIATALERRDVDQDTGKPQYGPAVTPALATDLLGYVDLVIMCKNEDEDGPARGLTKQNSRYRAKDRFGVMPRVMVQPSFDRIMGYLDDMVHEDDDPEQAKLSEAGKHSQDAVPAKPDTQDDDKQEDE